MLDLQENRHPNIISETPQTETMQTSKATPTISRETKEALKYRHIKESLITAAALLTIIALYFLIRI